MNKQEALDYIENGTEAVKVSRTGGAAHGDRVQLLGYGFTKPGKYSGSQRWTLEDWKAQPRNGKGVLIKYIDAHYVNVEVVQLRQLVATTKAAARAEYDAAIVRAKLEREQQLHQRQLDLAAAADVVLTTGGRVSAPYANGTVYIQLTLAEAQELAAKVIRYSETLYNAGVAVA